MYEGYQIHYCGQNPILNDSTIRLRSTVLTNDLLTEITVPCKDVTQLTKNRWFIYTEAAAQTTDDRCGDYELQKEPTNECKWNKRRNLTK